jgi:23S rRNA pseudouridine1911/1915/1917 synthase
VEPSDDGQRIDRLIAARTDCSRGEARRALARGSVWIGAKRVKVASRPAAAGQIVTVVLEEAGRSEPSAVGLDAARILFEDEHLIALDKPAGVAAQATLLTDRGTLLELASLHVGRAVGLVHRLDRDTSGVTLFGKSAAATSALGRAFRERHVSKRYLAAAAGPLPPAGQVDLPLAPDPRRQGRFVARPDARVPATTRYERLAARDGLCAVALWPETGRTHQIRAHLRALDAPIVGDRLYGGPRSVTTSLGSVTASRVLLHARSIELSHPLLGTTLCVTAPVPDDVTAALALSGVEPARL